MATRSSCCAMESAMSLAHWDAGLISGLTQRVKDLVLLELQHRSQPWLGFDPWPWNFHMLQDGQRGEKNRPTRPKDKKRDFNDTVNQLDPKAIYRTLHLSTTGHTFLSTRGAFSRMDSV